MWCSLTALLSGSLILITSDSRFRSRFNEESAAGFLEWMVANVHARITLFIKRCRSSLAATEDVDDLETDMK